MDKDGDKKGGGEKKGGGGGGGGGGQSGGTGLGGAAGVNDPAALLDAASLFAYWGRDPSAMAAAAASNPLFGSQFAMPGGLGGLMPNTGSGSGSGNDRFSMSHQHQNTMAVAASQAASLAGLHNSWWSMAQLAAQDYFARLQASGMSQLPFSHDLAGAFPAGLGLGAMGAAAAAAAAAAGGGSGSSPGGAGGSGGGSGGNTGGGGKGSGGGGKGKKRDRSSNSNSSNASSSGMGGGVGGMVGNPGGSGGGGGNSSYKNSSSPSVSQAAAAAAYKQSLYSQATLHKELMAITAAAAAAQNQQQPTSNQQQQHQQQQQQQQQQLQQAQQQHQLASLGMLAGLGGGGMNSLGGGGGGSSSKQKSSSSGGGPSSTGGSSSASPHGASRLIGNDSISITRGSSSPSVSASKQQPTPSVTISASHGSPAHQQNHLQNLSSSSSSSRLSKDSGKGGGSSQGCGPSAADLGLSASMNALSTLSQFNNLDLTTQQNVTATMNALAASQAKAKDYISSGILSDPSSLLGVRLPPDTEIIKYTSSIVGPKTPGATGRGRKKTISVEENSNFAQVPGLSAAKRQRLEPNEYGSNSGSGGGGGGSSHLSGGGSSSGGGMSLGSSSGGLLPPGLSAHHHHQLGSNGGIGGLGPGSTGGGGGASNDRIEVIKLPPTITSNGVYSASKGGKDSMADHVNEWAGLNLSAKGGSGGGSSSAAASIVSSLTAAANLGSGGGNNSGGSCEQDDAPLNLSMKPSKSSSAGGSVDLSGNSSTSSSAMGPASANSLQSLSTITAALGGSGGNDSSRSRRKTDNKNRRNAASAAAAAAAAAASTLMSTTSPSGAAALGGNPLDGHVNISLASAAAAYAAVSPVSSSGNASASAGGGSGGCGGSNLPGTNTTTGSGSNQQGTSSTLNSLLMASVGGLTNPVNTVSNSAATGSNTSSAASASACTNQQLMAAQLGFNSSLSELLKISNYEEYDYASLAGSQFKEGRPRNLGRGVSKPKKNTVASLLAQSRAVGSKPLTAQQLLTQEAEMEKLRQAMIEASRNQPLDNSTSNTNTDTESISESGMSESEGEEHINVSDLRVPLEKGWRRETVIRGLTKSGHIKGEVFYYPPQSVNKMKGMNQIQLYLDQFKPRDLGRDNFSFSAKAIVGTFLQPAPPPYATDGEYIKMTDVEVSRRLEELKVFTRHAALGVEQRIEIAKQQQLMRDAKKQAKEEMNKNKEKARQAKEAERNERLEQQRKERELKNQQALEAKKKREEEIARQKADEAARKAQEKEQKRQQAQLQKEQELAKQKELMYAMEMERERRRQHMALIKQLELRRKFEEKEKKKHQVILDKLIQREKKLVMRKRDTNILSELRKPQEDSEIIDQTELPTFSRIPGLKLTGTGYADLLMVFEFLHNFGETLGFDMESLPSLQSLHQALTSENAIDAEEELLSVMTHLLVCAIEDPGIPNPGRHTTLLGQTLRQADITHTNVSEILRIYLYAVATGEVRLQSGINLERDRDAPSKHHLVNDEDFKMCSTKNSQFYELLAENARYKLSELLKDKPFVALNPTTKTEILAMLCNDLLMNKAVCKQIDSSLEAQAQLKKERYLLDNKIRKYKMLVARKQRLEQYEKAQQAALEKSLSMKAAEEAKRVAEEAAALAAAAVAATAVNTDAAAGGASEGCEESAMKVYSGEGVTGADGVSTSLENGGPTEGVKASEETNEGVKTDGPPMLVGDASAADEATCLEEGEIFNKNDHSQRNGGDEEHKTVEHNNEAGGEDDEEDDDDDDDDDNDVVEIVPMPVTCTVTEESCPNTIAPSPEDGENGEQSKSEPVSEGDAIGSAAASSALETGSDVGKLAIERDAFTGDADEPEAAINGIEMVGADRKEKDVNGDGSVSQENHNPAIGGPRVVEESGPLAHTSPSLPLAPTMHHKPLLQLEPGEIPPPGMDLSAYSQAPLDIPTISVPSTPEESPIKIGDNGVTMIGSALPNGGLIKPLTDDHHHHHHPGQHHASNSSATELDLLSKSMIGAGGGGGVGVGGSTSCVGERVDDDNSDLESEGTQLEEDEDAHLTAEEAQRKYDKILETSFQNKQQLENALNQLRVKCFGQDRFWRRYWNLGKCGGIYVEAMESTQPEMYRYENALEELQARPDYVPKYAPAPVADHGAKITKRDPSNSEPAPGGDAADCKKEELELENGGGTHKVEPLSSVDEAGQPSASGSKRKRCSSVSLKKLKKKKKKPRTTSEGGASFGGGGGGQTEASAAAADDGDDEDEDEDEEGDEDDEAADSDRGEHEAATNDGRCSRTSVSNGPALEDGRTGDSQSDDCKIIDEPEVVLTEGEASLGRTAASSAVADVAHTDEEAKEKNSNVEQQQRAATGGAVDQSSQDASSLHHNSQPESTSVSATLSTTNAGGTTAPAGRTKKPDDQLMDIEDSIPTAILVQKGNDHDETKTVEVNSQIGGVNVVGSNPLTQQQQQQQLQQEEDDDVTMVQEETPTITIPDDDTESGDRSTDQRPQQPIDEKGSQQLTGGGESDGGVVGMMNCDMKPKLVENGGTGGSGEDGLRDPGELVECQLGELDDEESAGEQKRDADFKSTQKTQSATGKSQVTTTTTNATTKTTTSIISYGSDVEMIEVKEEEDEGCTNSSSLRGASTIVGPARYLYLRDVETKQEKEFSDQLLNRWFSIVDKELPLASTECPLPTINGHTPASMARQIFTNITCREICQLQGNRWDIGNNIQFFSVPLEKGVEIHFPNESILSLSGLDDDEIGDVIGRKSKPEPLQLSDMKPAFKRETIDYIYSQHHPNNLKAEVKDEAGGDPEEYGNFSLPAYMTLTLSNLTAYVQCDQFQPLQMTAEEEKQLEDIKLHGAPRKTEPTVVPREFRYGWWKINDIEELNELIKRLNPRGVRERLLRQSLLESLAESVNLSTPHHVAHPRAPPPACGYIEPEAWNAWNPTIARRVEIALLDQIEAMEDKVASASMQVKGWQMPQREGDSENGVVEDVTIEMLRERILGMEAAIERRYLKPPLGINTTEAQMAVIAQQEAHHNQNNSNVSNLSNCSNSSAEDENLPKGLLSWRDAVERSVTTAQLSMALYVLESCVAWDKSIMKALRSNEKVKKNGGSQRQKAAPAAGGGSKGSKKKNGVAGGNQAPPPLGGGGAQANKKSTATTNNHATNATNNSESGGTATMTATAGTVTATVAATTATMANGKAKKKVTSKSKLSSLLLQNCQFCQSGESEDKLLLCDGCDRGYHTYCFKPRMDKIPDGDWYCFECKNKATGERKCIVCGGLRPPPLGKMVYCELCPRAYHQDCYIPPMLKYPRGKWYCQNCVSKAPPKKKPQRKPKERTTNNSSQNHSMLSTSLNSSQNQSLNSSHEDIATTPLSPAHSIASTSHEESSAPQHLQHHPVVVGGSSSSMQATVPIGAPTTSSYHHLHQQYPQQQQQHHQLHHHHPQYSAHSGSAVPVDTGNYAACHPPVPLEHQQLSYQQQQQYYQQYYQTQPQASLPLPLAPPTATQQQYYPPSAADYNAIYQQQQQQQQSSQAPHQIIEGQPHFDGGASTCEPPAPAAVADAGHATDYESSINRDTTIAAVGGPPQGTEVNDSSQTVTQSADQQHAQQEGASSSPSTAGSSSSGSSEEQYYVPASGQTTTAACTSGYTDIEQQHSVGDAGDGGGSCGGDSSEEYASRPSPMKDSSEPRKERSRERDEAKERAKQEKKATKKLLKELAVCKTILEEMELHEDSWPFLLPVNTKQFPTYRKIIKVPMDLSTIKKRLQELTYKSRDDFIVDVRQIFDNCEVFNEDDSPVGIAGHGMRKFFEQRWTDLTDKHS